jgi:RNA ligase (TIGR02306 family)
MMVMDRAMNSTHKVEVYHLDAIEKHPNADTLGIVRFGGYQVCVKLGDFHAGQLAAYILPDSVVPDRPEYAFLGGKFRIKAKRLRGEWSMGLLIHAPEGANEGDDIAEQLGITHYEPPIDRLSTGGDCVAGPSSYPQYDVESFRRYAQVAFTPGELVYVTEKIHGTNGRFVYHNGEMFCGSKTTWKKNLAPNVWWRALKSHPRIEAFCLQNPDVAVYGEVYGSVQELKYGVPRGEVRIALFDIYRNGRWIDASELYTIADAWKLPTVPVIKACPYDFDTLLALAEGPSLIPGADHHREGIVVKPYSERYAPQVHGRVSLKIISNEYLAKS